MKKYPLEIVAPVVFVFVFLLTLIYSRIEPHVEDIDMNYVKQYAGRSGYVLVDVRPEEVFYGESPMPEVPGGHIPGAISFPLEDLKIAAASAALAKVGIIKSNTVILYGNTGTTAGKFADTLIRKFNFSPSHIKNYRGSVIDWVSHRGNALLPIDHETGYESVISEHTDTE